MTGDILALCLANGLMLLLGAGVLPLLRLAPTPRDLLQQLPLAYAIGLSLTGVIAANLALVDISIGRVGLPVMAAIALVAGGWFMRRRPSSRFRTRRDVFLVPAAGLLLVVACFLGNAAWLFAVMPLVENDGWAIWGLR